jgi:MFS family permease
MTKLTSPAAGPAALTRRQSLILVLLLGTQFMLAVDFSVFNVALPAIGRSVGISLSHVEWIATTFALPTAGFTLFFGRVADLVGRRRLFTSALWLLIAASIIGGVAQSAPVLLGARLLQGLATAATIPSAFALLVAAFPEGPQRQRALGLNGSLLSGGFTVGALLGGVLTTALSWRWAFLFNVPVAAAIVLAAPRIIPESRSGAHRLDAPGAIAATLALLVLVFGVVTSGDDHWRSLPGWAAIAAGLLLLGVFCALERRAAHPLVPLGVLRRRNVGWGNLGGFAVFSMESALVFVLTVYLQRVLGYSALDAGLMLGVPGIAAFVSGIIAPRTMARTGHRALLAGGLFIQGVTNLLLLTVAREGVIVPVLLAVTAVSFFAHVHAIVGFTVTATSGVPEEEQGLATSLLTMTQQTAITMGIPIIGTLATATGAVGAGELIHDVRLAIAVDSVITIAVAALVACALVRPRVLGRVRGLVRA